jgi:hypothetical protein
LIREPNASPPIPLISNGMDIRRDAPDSFHVVEQVQERVLLYMLVTWKCSQ